MTIELEFCVCGETYQYICKHECPEGRPSNEHPPAVQCPNCHADEPDVFRWVKEGKKIMVDCTACDAREVYQGEWYATQ